MFKSIDAVIFDFDDTLVDFTTHCNLGIDTYYEYTLPLLHAIKYRYCMKVGVITNAPRERQELRVNDIFKFDHVVYGDEELKPSKVPYLKMCIELGVKPKQCVMIGNDPEVDLITANQLGMRTVLYNGLNKYTAIGNYLKSLGMIDYIVEDYGQVLEWLTEITHGI